MRFPDEAGETLPRLYFIQALENLKSKLNPQNFKLGIVTDSHFDEGTWRTQAYRSLKNLNNILYLQNDLDVLAALGDNVDSEHKDKTINVRNLERYCKRFAQGTNQEKFIIRGNHDAGSLVWDTQNAGNLVLESNILTGPEQLNIFKQMLNQNGKVYDSSGQYHYKDYPDKKIRVVLVDTLDNPSVTNSNGTLKYVDQWNFGMQEKQLKWIAEKALGTLPNEYHVVFLSHVPIMPANINSDPVTNSAIFIGILTAFVKKTKQQFKSTVQDFNAVVDVDFTGRSQSNLVGSFAGHRHAEYFYTPDKMGEFYSLVLDCAFVRDDSKIGTVKEDALSVLEIDTANRHVKLFGFGRENDHEYTY